MNVDDRTAVATALEAVGTHRSVRVEVIEVRVLASSVDIDLALHYARATPVCCGEPGCYIGFLGRNRALVPESLGTALGMPPPAITVRAHLRHEPNYRYIDPRGRDGGPGIDFTATYPPEHFQVARPDS